MLEAWDSSPVWLGGLFSMRGRGELSSSEGERVKTSLGGRGELSPV